MKTSVKERLDIFREGLINIKDSKIRKVVVKALSDSPDYFWKVPASSTCKYHNPKACEESGLARVHVRWAMNFALMMFENPLLFPLSDKEKDIAISAIIMHDLYKSGTQEDFERNKYTKFEHPIIVSQHIRPICEEVGLDKETTDVLCRILESHMGQWNTSPRSKVVLPKPESFLEKFVHLCDYVASRKFITFDN